MSSPSSMILWELLDGRGINFADYLKITLEELGYNNLLFLETFDSSQLAQIKEKCRFLTDQDVQTLTQAQIKIKDNNKYFYTEFQNRLDPHIRVKDDFQLLDECENFELNEPKKKKPLSNITNEFYLKFQNDKFKNKLRDKLMNILTVFVFKHNSADDIDQPSISIVNGRLNAKIKCPECDGTFTVQTLVRNLNVKWITCNIKRHYKRHFAEDYVLKPTTAPKTIEKSSPLKNDTTDNEENYEEVTFLDSEYQDMLIKAHSSDLTENKIEEDARMYEEVHILDDSELETYVREDIQESPAKNLKQSDVALESSSHSKIVEEEDEDWLFCRSLWATMKKMSTKNKNKLKIELLTLTSERQLEDESG